MGALIKLALATVFLAIASIGSAGAVTITNGFTFTVADQFGGAVGVGTHFHSNTGGSFGNPAGLAEVGRLSPEETRGLAEFNLAGQLVATSAFVTFDVNQLGGLFGQSNFNGNIDINAYVGNNTEDLSDFQIATSGAVGSFNSTPLVVGNTLSFDILSIFNAAIGNGGTSLGIRLQINPLLTANEAIVFNNFLLSTDDRTSVVPVPAALPLFGTALLGLGFAGYRKRKAKSA